MMRTPTSCREVAERYSEEQNKLAKKILELISESLGLQPFYMSEYLGGVQYLMVNYYPSCPQPDLAIGLVKHSDLGLLTLLLQDGNPGLQVLKDGEWITVRPMEGVFVVNLGDQMEVIIYLKLHITWFLFYLVESWLHALQKGRYLLRI
jgi:isopenicillin N synthase-like dioxygenase